MGRLRCPPFTVHLSPSRRECLETDRLWWVPASPQRRQPRKRRDGLARTNPNCCRFNPEEIEVAPTPFPPMDQRLWVTRTMQRAFNAPFGGVAMKQRRSSARARIEKSSSATHWAFQWTGNLLSGRTSLILSIEARRSFGAKKPELSDLEYWKRPAILRPTG